MPKKNAPTETDRDLNLATLSELFVSEDAARKFIESKRWPNGPVCPHCKSVEVYTLIAKADSKHPVRPGVYKCAKCRKQFTVRIGTIFEESKVPLCKWLMAFHLMTSSKKGVSSHQIARECGLTQKTAWFLNHRIREAMKKEPMASMLQGVVEVDETFVGGKPRKIANVPGKPYFTPQDQKFASDPEVKKRRKNPPGRGTDKQPVMVLVERDGSARCFPLENVQGKTLKNEIAVHVAKDAIIMTDEYRGYTGIRETPGGHRTVKHCVNEYARRDPDGMLASTNSAESFFALLKRGHYGIFHKLSKKHLHRYCTEFAFRWDGRRLSDGERMVDAIKGAEGKRLMYREPALGLVS